MSRLFCWKDHNGSIFDASQRPWVGGRYEECIRFDIKQKTYAMPFWALGLNFAWELIYTVSDIFLKAHGPLEEMNLVQAAANAAWACLPLIG